MNEKPLETYSSITFGPVGWQPPEYGRKLSAQERSDQRNRGIDDAEREMLLIRQGVGKWPKDTVMDRLQGLLKTLEFYIGERIDLTSTKSQSELFTVIEMKLTECRATASISPLTQIDESGIAVWRWWFLLAAVWCFILAFADFKAAWIYDLSNWALCGLCGYKGFQSWKEGAKRILVPLGILAVIFNPFAPIRFGDAWKVVDSLAGATFLGAFLCSAGWIEKAWRKRKMIGIYAFMGALACFTASILAEAYLDSKNGDPERRAAELKERKAKADAVERERLMKSVLGDDYRERISRKVYADWEAEHPTSRIPILPLSEPTYYDPSKVGHSPDSYGKDANWYPGKSFEPIKPP